MRNPSEPETTSELQPGIHYYPEYDLWFEVLEEAPLDHVGISPVSGRVPEQTLMYRNSGDYRRDPEQNQDTRTSRR